MAPPAAGPLIQGSTTPIAKETATAASTASPPASSTLAPTSAARRCAAATTPPRVGIDGFADDLGAGEVVHGSATSYCALSRAKRTMSAWVANQTLPRALAWRISSSRIQTRER